MKISHKTQIRWSPRQWKFHFPLTWDLGRKDPENEIMEQDESFSKSLRWSTLEQLQQSQQLQNYQNGWEEVANFAPHSKPTPDINEDEEDKLSKVEKLLMSKGRHTQLSGLTTKDADGDVGTTTTGVQWVVGEWTECLDVECFNWNTGKLIILMHYFQ